MQDLRFCGLRIPKVHHLVKQLVDDDKVVADGFFFQLFEILGEDFDDFVEEQQDLGGVGVAFCESEEVEVVVPDVEVL